MASKFTYDTTNKLFILNSGVTSLNAKTEFYSAVKYDWLTDDSLNKFRFPILSIGGNDIGGGASISPYYSLAYGWRIQFAPEDQTLSVYGNIITVEGELPFAEQPGPYQHIVQYQVSANSITTGSAPLTAADVWNLSSGIEPSLTPAQAMQILVAVLAGKVAITGDQIVFRDPNDTRDVVDALTTADGERTAVTLNVT